MTKCLKNFFEISVAEYEHTKAGETLLRHLTKISKRWKLNNVLIRKCLKIPNGIKISQINSKSFQKIKKSCN